MLNELDKELDERELNFVRYANDCIIFVRSEKAAYQVLISVTKFIEKKLGLKARYLNKKKFQRAIKKLINQNKSMLFLLDFPWYLSYHTLNKIDVIKKITKCNKT